MKSLPKHRGKVPIGGFLTFLIIIGLIYGAIVYYPLFKTHYRLKEIVHEAGNKAVHEKDETRLREYIIRQAEKRGITINHRDVYIRRSESDNMIYINITYWVNISYPLTGIESEEDFTIYYETDLTPLDWQELKEKTKF
ncbi:MAG: hypothetical protein Kow0090_11840 [Myxococcota bacterium]